ncbi:class I SAM-dependent methyltransferase [Kitasatospora sp. NPDC052896]|uniref:class I SAM-dependent methyltransferase n=1 Tax=Kitasatospora sp. NPDC052896 TaxID=3364061 RepID=UPI0037C7D2BD
MAHGAPGRARHRMWRIARTFAADPVEAVLSLPAELGRWRERPMTYRADEEWEAGLHHLLGAPWPCPWTTTDGSDGDWAPARAVRCAVLHRHPEVVLESGAAGGAVSRLALEALEHNGHGRLWSVEPPGPQRPAAVPERHRERWTRVQGSSRRQLAGLVRELGTVGVFVHHTRPAAPTAAFELDQVARVLPPGGVMLVDDLGTDPAFASWTGDPTRAATLVCASSLDGARLFGVICTNAAAARRHRPRRSAAGWH